MANLDQIIAPQFIALNVFKWAEASIYIFSPWITFWRLFGISKYTYFGARKFCERRYVSLFNSPCIQVPDLTESPFLKEWVHRPCPISNQRTREGCGCFRGLFGGSRGFSWESPRKIVEKMVPNRKMLQILGFRAPGKANLLGTCREPWVDTAWTLSPPSVRAVFWHRQFLVFSSFSDWKSFHLRICLSETIWLGISTSRATPNPILHWTGGSVDTSQDHICWSVLLEHSCSKCPQVQEKSILKKTNPGRLSFCDVPLPAVLLDEARVGP